MILYDFSADLGREENSGKAVPSVPLLRSCSLQMLKMEMRAERMSIFGITFDYSVAG